MTGISCLRRIAGALLLSVAILTSFTVGATAGTRRSTAQMTVFAAASLSVAFPKFDGGQKYNFAGTDAVAFIKQYAEFGFPYPLVGFNLNTGDAWAAGEGNLSGTWPTVRGQVNGSRPAGEMSP